MPDGKTGIGPAGSEPRVGEPRPSEPYLSLVVTARNDDHGGNLLQRMQIFVSGWLAQARRHRIPSELIIVEWNPPGDRPRLREALEWPADFGPCEVRFIEVPAALHRRYAHAEALPLYQMIAKNVGIRRARGRFVLATNIDILFSDELASFLAQQRLEPGRMYRIDRHDVASDVPGGASVEEQLAYCRTHLIRLNAREGSFPVSPDGRIALSPIDVVAVGAGILLGKGWLPLERYGSNEVFRWAREEAEVLLKTPPGQVAALLVDVEPGPSAGAEPVDLEIAAGENEILARVSIDARSRVRLPFFPALPDRLWFRTYSQEAAFGVDPRVLNLRFFRLEWETGAPAAGPCRATVTREPRAGRVAAAWRALQYAVRKLATGGPIVPMSIPVPPRLQRRLKSYVDWGGVTGLVREGIAYRMKRPGLRQPPGSDIFQTGSGLSPGAGWKGPERFRGELSRRVATGAELIVDGSSSGARELWLRVEPAQTGCGPLELSLIDQQGQAVARRKLNGLEYVQFPVPRLPDRTAVYRLEWGAAGGPSPGPDECKVYWCGWDRRAQAARLNDVAPPPWGAGWQRDPAGGAMTASRQAELLLRAVPGGLRPLFLELETASPAAFEIRDCAGRTLERFEIEGRRLRRLELPLEAGRTHVLQILSSGPFRAYRCGWDPTPAASHGSAPGRRRAAEFLHTNACGDFTLIARDNWFDLRGYPEFDLFSMNLDSVFCFAAHYGGAREEALAEPMRIYHVEHGSGSGWTPEGQAKLFARIAASGLSFVDNDEVLTWAAQMRHLNAPMIFNREDWGLAEFDLEETAPPGRGAA